MNNNIENQIVEALNLFTRGLGQHSIPDIYKGHKTLYKIGASSVPYISDTILRTDWKTKSSQLQIGYINGLFSLLHDIDETESEKVANHVIRNGCNRAVEQRIKTIIEFSIKDYKQYNILGVSVFESKKIKTKQPIQPILECWLPNVPKNDLKEIERLYVLPMESQDYSGTYTPMLYNIRIVWDNSFSKWNPISRFFNFQIEKTLYHEIGHHVHRHTFGQDPKQEAEANQYAYSILRSSSSKFIKLLKAIHDTLVLCRVYKKNV